MGYFKCILIVNRCKPITVNLPEVCCTCWHTNWEQGKAQHWITFKQVVSQPSVCYWCFSTPNLRTTLPDQPRLLPPPIADRNPVVFPASHHRCHAPDRPCLLLQPVHTCLRCRPASGVFPLLTTGAMPIILHQHLNPGLWMTHSPDRCSFSHSRFQHFVFCLFAHLWFCLYLTCLCRAPGKPASLLSVTWDCLTVYLPALWKLKEFLPVISAASDPYHELWQVENRVMHFPPGNYIIL